MSPLNGKTALVTGASRGIGRASALALAKAGAQVLVHYCHEDKAANEVVAQIRAAGGHAEKVAADLRTPDVRVVIGARLDILVASAGVTKDASIEDTTVDDFDELFALNVRAPYFLVQQLMPAMCKGSSVVLVSSLAAHASVGSLSAYAATKGAIDTLVKHFALALGGRGVRVNAIAPGVVATGMSARATTESGREATLEMQTLKHIAQCEDIGGTVVFLASDAARWITGETLCVDGRLRL
jgi:3-oxoacyl-[acyl-carrier protein] reductase